MVGEKMSRGEKKLKSNEEDNHSSDDHIAYHHHDHHDVNWENDQKEDKIQQNLPSRNEKDVENHSMKNNKIWFSWRRNIWTCNRWFGLIAGMIVMSVTGTQYVFGSIGPTIQRLLSFPEHELNTIVICGNIGTYFGFIPAAVNDILGPRIALCIAGLFMGVGYLMSLCACLGWVGTSGGNDYSLVFFFCCASWFLIGNGASASYTACVSSNIKNFGSQHRGKVVGILVGIYGLSGAIFGVIYSYIFNQNIYQFLLFTSITLTVIPWCGLLFINIIPTRYNSNHHQQKYHYHHDHHHDRRQQQHHHHHHQQFDSNGATNDNQNKLQVSQNEFSYQNEEHALLNVKNKGKINDGDKSPRNEIHTSINDENLNRETLIIGINRNYNPFQMVFTLDFILVNIVMFCIVGSGLMTINNMGSIIISYGGRDGDQGIFVILISIFSSFGRTFFGIISDRLADYFARTCFITLTAFMMTVSQYCFSFAPIWSFYVLVPLFATSYGGIFCLVPTFISERYGPKYFGVNFSFGNIGTLLGGYIISVFIASKLYELHISQEGGNVCYGRKCFRWTFLITTALCTIALSLSFVLMIRCRKMYNDIHNWKERRDNIPSNE